MLFPAGRASRHKRERFCRSVFVAVRLNANRPRFDEQATHLSAAIAFASNSRASHLPAEAAPAVPGRLCLTCDSYHEFTFDPENDQSSSRLPVTTQTTAGQPEGVGLVSPESRA
jgi:hypothetical protein